MGKKRKKKKGTTNLVGWKPVAFSLEPLFNIFYFNYFL
jgi:hypothetical protein